NQITNQVTRIQSLLTSSLNIHLNIGQNLSINTSQSFVFLETISIESLNNKIIKQIENSQFNLPSSLTFNSTSVLLRQKVDPLASYGNFQNTNLSRSISLSFIDKNGKEISFKTNENNLIQIRIPRDPNLLIPPMYLQDVLLNGSSLFNYQYINITSSLPISIHLDIHPLNINLSYLFIYKFDENPQLNNSIYQIDGWTIFCSNKHLTNDYLYQYFLDNQQTLNHQSLIYGIRELNSTEFNIYCLNNSSSIPIIEEKVNFTSNYEIRIYTSGCYYLDENNQWNSNGLIVGSNTNHYETECYSKHLTTFAGGFIVLPEPINWNYIFANADFVKNKTIYITIICTIIIYIILLIYARFKDKIDLEKLGVIPLADNNKFDKYFYQIIVFTGQRTNAGTNSNVHFILAGDDDQTNIRTFSSSQRKIFQRGGIDAFVMSVPKSLGLLNYIRIWHDNSGYGPLASWYLKYIIIQDLQTLEKFYFISQQWFAVEKEDGKIERILPVAGEIEKEQFSYVLSKKAYHNLSSDHLWFSIFSRPPSNKFTRVQRCTSCFVLFFTAMLMNIMYYDLSKQAQNTNQSFLLTMGPLYITPQQIGIGIMMEFFTFIPSILIVQFFRRIRPRQQISPLQQTLMKIKRSLPSNMVSTEKKKRSQLTFPWWCLFIAYGLSIIIILVSILFIIVRGIEFGDIKTQQWLTSVLTGFFSSILLTQPIKIICMAIFLALFCRNSTNDKEASEYINDDDRIDLQDDLHSSDISLFNSPTSKHINRLNENEVAYAREQRLKEIQMWSIIHEFMIYFLFALLVFIVTYYNREENSYFQVKHLQTYLLNRRQSNADYSQIRTVDQYWYWLENSFIENLRTQQWYNGNIPQYLNGFLNDKSNRLIGWATMRQLRVKSELCDNQRIISLCEENYNLFNEDKHSFQPGWIINRTGVYGSSIIKAFQYETSDTLDTSKYIGEYATYSGGGYVYEFRGSLINLKTNISLLHQLEWIDQHTRAILIELTLYNSNVQLLTSVTLLTEFLSTGGVFPSSRFEPINFYTFTSITQLICTIFYMLFIIYFTIIEIRLFLELRLKYFHRFWSMILLGIIICSYTSVGIYIWRYHETNRISQLFSETNGYVYINLQHIIYINNILTYLLGYCCFFGLIKFVNFFRYDQRVSLFTQTLHYCRKELLSFGFMFSILFLSFIFLFYFLFVSKISSCSNLMASAQMLFEMTLMKFDAHELIEADPMLGPICFAIFILLIVFVCLSMFISIINDSFHHAKDKNADNHVIWSFMMKRFLLWTGLKKLTRSELQEEIDAQMRTQYYDLIENFPDKIDQLLIAIDKIYINQIDESTRLRKAGV
ncbi:unnamed protein product, partial [Adineta ricciae]